MLVGEKTASGSGLVLDENSVFALRIVCSLELSSWLDQWDYDELSS